MKIVNDAELIRIIHADDRSTIDVVDNQFRVVACDTVTAKDEFMKWHFPHLSNDLKKKILEERVNYSYIGFKALTTSKQLEF